MSISKEHAIIEFLDDGSVVIKDLNSRNGTFVNGERISENKPVPISQMDKLSFGKETTEFRVQIHSKPWGSSQKPAGRVFHKKEEQKAWEGPASAFEEGIKPGPKVN